jgi:hypothetical protein
VTSTKTSVLVCGDAGPARHTLLSRPDIEVVWADTLGAARAAFTCRLPDVCLVCPRQIKGDALKLIEALRARGDTPCVVLLSRDDWDQEGIWLRMGATEVVESERSDLVTRILSELTGLAFAREPRTDFRTVVEIRHDGEELVLESTNLSASGAAIRGFPSAEVGTLVRVSFVVQHEPVVLWARVVRTWSNEDDTFAGLRFAGVSEQQRRSIRRFVHDRNASEPSQSVDLERLLAELAQKSDGSGSSRPSSADRGESDLALLTRYLKASSVDRETLPIPRWMRRAIDSLTSIEVEAALKFDQASWAREVIAVRLALACWRATHHSTPPRALAERAYASFCNLAHTTDDQTDEVQAQVGMIRAAILRELLTSSHVRRDVPQSVPPAPPTADLPGSQDLQRITH